MESYGEFLSVIFAPMKILDVVSFPESCWDYGARSPSSGPVRNLTPEIQPAEVGETKQAATQSDHIDQGQEGFYWEQKSQMLHAGPAM